MYHAIVCLTVPKLSYLGEHSEVSQARSDSKEAWHYNHVTFTLIANRRQNDLSKPLKGERRGHTKHQVS